MREVLHRFFRAARGAGVRISPAESIDAMRAAAEVGPGDREILRDVLLLTMAKSGEEKAALAACFDTFFTHPDFETPPAANDDQTEEEDGSSEGAHDTAEGTAQGQASTELGALAQMLLAQDRAAIAAA